MASMPHMRRMRPSLTVIALAVAVGAIGAIAPAAQAQNTLSVGSSTVTILSPTQHEYDQGYSVIGQMNFSGSCASSTSSRPCSITVWAPSSTMGGNARSIGDVQWQVSNCAATTACSPVTTWQPLSTTPWSSNVALIAAPASASANPATFSGVISFRIQIGWATYPAGQAYAPAIQLGIAQ